MSRRGIALRLAAGSFVILLLLTPLGVAAESLQLTWEPATGVTLTADPTSDPTANPTSASGSAILRNPSAIDLAVTVRLEGDDLDDLTVESTPKALPAGSVQKVEITVKAASGTVVGRSGYIVATGMALPTFAPQPSGDVVGPALAPFAIATSAPATPTTLVPEPAAIAITVDRCLPSFLPFLQDCQVFWPPEGREVPDPFHVPDPASDLVIWHGTGDLKDITTTWLLGGDDGTTKVAIDPGVPTADGTTARYRLTGNVIRGAYSGPIPLHAGTPDSPSVTASIHVQDHVIWAFGAILLGVGLAYWIVPRYDRKRARYLVVQRMVEVFEATGDRTCELPLDAFPPPGPLDPVTGKPIWPQPSSSTGTPADALLAEIQLATTNERLQELADQVEELATVVAQWKAACANRAKLADAIASVTAHGQAVPSDAPILVASKALAERLTPFVEKEASTEFADALHDQALAIVAWWEAWQLYRKSEALWGVIDASKGLSREERDTLNLHHPDQLRHVYFWPAEDLEAVDRLEIDRHSRDLYAVLRSLASSHGLSEPSSATRAPAAETPVPDKTVAGLEPVVVPSSAVILARIREADWRQFLISTLIASIVYLGLIYPGTDFGTVWQYLSAVLAGTAGGVLVVNWELLPWSRSYRAKGATAG